jgi:NADPH:quinone reductase-like Zn-dependent oxidoreductase
MKKTTMRAAQGINYGPIDKMIHVVEDAPIPTLSDMINTSTKQKKSKQHHEWVVIRTLAVALAPGDVRVLSGKTRIFQGPKSFPYTVGGDVCGQVVEVSPAEHSEHQSKAKAKEERSNPNEYHDFEVGDVILARFHDKPMGAMGEYALVHTKCCDRVPAGVSPEGAAALGSSGLAALRFSKRYIRKGERVLVLGAGGGVGSHFVQLARHQAGASFVAGVARDAERLTADPLSCDVGVDYTKEDPYLRQDFLEEPFDVIMDFDGKGWLRLLEDRKKYGKSKRGCIVKPASQGGRYLTCATDDPWFSITGVWSILKLFLFTNLWRATYSRISPTTRSTLPTFSFVMGLPSDRAPLTEVLQLARDKAVVPCIDPAGPFPFTTNGVRDAMKLQESRHGRGKVVVHVADL